MRSSTRRSNSPVKMSPKITNIIITKHREQNYTDVNYADASFRVDSDLVFSPPCDTQCAMEKQSPDPPKNQLKPMENITIGRFRASPSVCNKSNVKNCKMRLNYSICFMPWLHSGSSSGVFIQDDIILHILHLVMYSQRTCSASLHKIQTYLCTIL